MAETLTPLTEEQVANWRKILALQLGPYALLMPVEEIELIRAAMQSHADELAEELDDEGNHA